MLQHSVICQFRQTVAVFLILRDLVEREFITRRRSSILLIRINDVPSISIEVADISGAA